MYTILSLQMQTCNNCTWLYVYIHVHVGKPYKHACMHAYSMHVNFTEKTYILHVKHNYFNVAEHQSTKLTSVHVHVNMHAYVNVHVHESVIAYLNPLYTVICIKLLSNQR